MSLSQLGIVKKQKKLVRNLRRILRLDIDNSRLRIFEEFIGLGRLSCYCRQSELGARNKRRALVANTVLEWQTDYIATQQSFNDLHTTELAQPLNPRSNTQAV